jgi:hypothetical protein
MYYKSCHKIYVNAILSIYQKTSGLQPPNPSSGCIAVVPAPLAQELYLLTYFWLNLGFVHSDPYMCMANLSLQSNTPSQLQSCNVPI